MRETSKGKGNDQMLQFLNIFRNDDSEKLQELSLKISLLTRGIRKMALDLVALTEAVSRLETVEASAVTLIQHLVDEVAANKNDPVALQALVDRVTASNDVLAAAVAANTPAAPVDPVVTE